MSGFRIVPPNCTDFQKSVSQRVFKISTWEKVRKKAANIYYFFNKIYFGQQMMTYVDQFHKTSKNTGI